MRVVAFVCESPEGQDACVRQAEMLFSIIGVVAVLWAAMLSYTIIRSCHPARFWVATAGSAPSLWFAYVLIGGELGDYDVLIALAAGWLWGTLFAVVAAKLVLWSKPEKWPGPKREPLKDVLVLAMAVAVGAPLVAMIILAPLASLLT